MQVDASGAVSSKPAAPFYRRLKKGGLAQDLIKNRALYLIGLPAILFFFVFSYLPMVGIIIAFENYKPLLGVFGSPFVGLENFRFLFVSGDAWRIMFNTVFLNLLFITFGTVCQITVAILYNEIRSKSFKRINQSVILLPNFISWVIVGVFSYYIFNINGLLNQLTAVVGLGKVDWYTKPGYWPAFLTMFSVWKGLGFGSVIYLAVIAGIDQEVLEAGIIDGCNRWQSIWHLMLPYMKPTVIILTLLAVGRIFNGDFGLVFNITRSFSGTYKYTDVIDTYVYRALTGMGGTIRLSSAAGLLQSVLGFSTILVANSVVRRLSRENALF